jgi:O-antigen/teichoic acid export membrane protein
MNSSRVNNSLRNAFYGVLSRIILIILNFINRTVFIMFLSDELLGVSGLFSDILMMLSLADLGLGVSMAYSFYKPLAEDDKDKISSLIGFYRKMYTYIAAVVFVVGVALTPFLDFFVNTETEIEHLQIYYLIYVLNTVASYLFVYKSSLITADQKNFVVYRFNIIFNIIKHVLQITLLVITRNYFVYLAVIVFCTFFQNIFISREADRLYPYLKEKPKALEKTEQDEVFSNVKAMFLYKSSGVLLSGTDNIIISKIIGTVFVGFYSNYLLIANSIMVFVDILYSSVTASVGNVIAKESKKKAFEVFQMMQSVSLIITFISTVCFGVLIQDFIHLWIGPKYMLDTLTVWAIILNFYLGGVVHPIWSFREATGMYLKTKYIMAICAVLNIILSIVLGIYFGIGGVVAASAISRVSTYFWYEPKILFEDYFDQGLSKFMVPVALNLALTILYIILFKWILSNIAMTSYFVFFAEAVVIGLITLVSVAVIYRKTEGYRMLKDVAFRFFKKKKEA